MFWCLCTSLKLFLYWSNCNHRLADGVSPGESILPLKSNQYAAKRNHNITASGIGKRSGLTCATNTSYPTYSSCLNYSWYSCMSMVAGNCTRSCMYRNSTYHSNNTNSRKDSSENTRTAGNSSNRNHSSDRGTYRMNTCIVDMTTEVLTKQRVESEASK